MNFPWQANPAPYVSESAKEDLETKFVDRTSLSSTLTALEEIAYAKAQHIRENWQDEALAKRWERAGRAIEKAAAKARSEGV